jgi:hypothetical protein
MIEAPPIHVNVPKCLKRGTEANTIVTARANPTYPTVQIACSEMAFSAIEIASIVIPADSVELSTKMINRSRGGGWWV